MIFPGVIGQQQLLTLGGGGGELWTPLNMATVPQIYLDAQESAITEISGAVSSVSNLGAMGSNGVFNQPGVPSSRPALITAELNGNAVLRFDGVNDVLLGTTTAQKALTNAAACVWVFVVMKKRTADAANTTRTVFMATIATSTGSRFRLNYGNSGIPNKNTPGLATRRADSDTLVNLVSPSESSGTYRMLLALSDYQSQLGQIHENGAVTASDATLTTLGSSTTASNSQEPLTIGAQSSAANAVDGDIACVLVSNTRPSDTDIDKLFGWAAHKYGLTANLPGGHPYKTVAPTV